MLKFRKLAAGDVQVRSTVKPNGVLVLMYKNARVDMAILDEAVGPFNWQRQHEGKFCRVSIKNPETGEWVTKEDIGFCDSPDPEMQEKGEPADFDQIAAEITERDHRDMTREVSPLRQADDAVLVDTSDMTIDQVTQRILEIVKERTGLA